MTSWESFFTIWLRTGIQKTMPSLVARLEKIKMESPSGTKLWVSRVEIAHPQKLHALVQLTKGKRQEELLDVDFMLRKAKAEISQIVLPGYPEENLLIQNVQDGYALQNKNPNRA